MGGKLSFMRIFEFINDVHVTIGSGLLGFGVLAWKGAETYAFRTLFVSTATVVSAAYGLSKREKHTPNSRRVIFITGCDSGLGFSMAHHACEMGFSVLAGCMNVASPGAALLQDNFRDQVVLVELDLTKDASTYHASKFTEKFLEEFNFELWAIINNAGIMVFGEFEWLTERQIMSQIHVNLFGTLHLTKIFMPLLRKYSGRLITITSHCAQATLPGLAVYGATKTALAAWSDGLRMEVAKYGVEVITFIPGSFIQQSNIMAHQNDHVFEMQQNLTEEQRHFYGEYFKDYYVYLRDLAGERTPKKIIDHHMFKVFENALLDVNPSSVYKSETWRYKFYHFLFKFTPTRISDFLIISFIQMPKFKRPKVKTENTVVV